MNQTTINKTPQQDIILDTNILFYLGDNNIKTNLLNYLLELGRRGFILSISKVTICELFSGIPRQKEIEAGITLNIFKQYSIDDNVIITTSQLSTVYKNAKTVKTDGIDFEDRVISATAMLTGSLILTADVNDYPRPYFTEREERVFFFRNKNKTNIRVVQILQPNIFLINHSFLSRP